MNLRWIYLGTLVSVVLMMGGCKTFNLPWNESFPAPSEYVLLPGPPPPVPEEGTLEELVRVYLHTVDLYAECEDKRHVMREAFSEAK